MGKLFTLTWVLSAFWCVSWAQNSEEGFSQELLEIDRELRALQSAGGSGLEVERFQKEAIRDRWEQLVSLRMQLRSLDPDGQPISSKVDYLLVVARSNEMLFEFQSSRPWTRDPLFYLDAIRVLPYQSLTGDTDALERLEADLRRVPAWLELARENLVEASGQLADMALFHLENYDGVGQGEPFRNPPPAGILGWYQDLAQRAGESSAPLAEAARRALQELEALRDWLSQHRGFMIEPAHLGWSRYQWFVRNVRLMPFSVGQISTLGQREFARARAQLEIERRRNRDLPPLEPAGSRAEYQDRVRRAEQNIRERIGHLGLLSIPEGLPVFETDAFWREGMKRHFWEEIQHRDAHNNHIHASIPGHRFDRLIASRVANPIRSAVQDGGRIEGWAFYVESMLLNSGLLDDRPRARELFQIAELARASRIPIELRMQNGELSLDQAVREMVRQVPLMEENLARYDLEIYLRRPAYGMNYVMGRVQLEDLLAQQCLARGETFELGDFHDRFLSFGWIPISLIGWEMNGWDEMAEEFWRARMADFRNSSH